MVRHVLFAGLACSCAAAQPCLPSWQNHFAGGDFDGPVRASVVFNDGNGAALYAAGSFSRAGGVPAGGVARWTGSAWVAVGAAFNGDVNALHVHTDGSLYAAGRFTSVGTTVAYSVAKWNGTAWVAASFQQLTGIVRALTSAPNSQGTSKLWVAGQGLNVTTGGSGFAARLEGSTWTFAGDPPFVAMEVYALAVFTENGQDRLFAAGVDRANPPVSTVRRWNFNSGWDPVGNPGVVGRATALGTFFDGSGAALFAAGDVTSAGGQPVNRIAKWNGQAWSPVGAGLNIPVNCLALFDPDAQGPLPLGIIAGGARIDDSGLPASPIWYWNGSTWAPRASGMNDSVYTMTPFQPFSLFIGGSFSSTGAVAASRAAYMDATGFHAMANSNVGNAPSETVRCFEWFDDDGPGPHAAKLYVGGHFQSIGSLSASSIGAWDGTSWSSLGSHFNGYVGALKAHDDGTGSALYAGGSFTMVDGIPVSRVARWNGQAWSAVGAGLNGTVLELETFAPAAGPENLYACGYFSAPQGGIVQGVGRWDGAAWKSIPAAILVQSVTALKAFSGPGGRRLYLAHVSNTNNGVLEWSGTTLANVTTGLGTQAYVSDLEVFDDGAGPAVYAGGIGLSPNFMQPACIARFTGSGWTFVPGSPWPWATTLQSHDDGNGPALYAGAMANSVQGLGRWNGSSWTAFSGNLAPPATGLVSAMRSVDHDGPGPEKPVLYVGGTFTSIGGVSAANIARWSGCGCYANCDGSTASPILAASDFVCFLSTFAAGQSYANCDGSAAVPVLTGNDFVCFLNAYVTGCP
jgi:hypothetical protein